MNQSLEERIENDFSFHPATPITGPQHEDVRAECKDLAFYLVAACPQSRELSLALTALEETMHWANAAIAKHSGGK